MVNRLSEREIKRVRSLYHDSPSVIKIVDALEEAYKEEPKQEEKKCKCSGSCKKIKDEGLSKEELVDLAWVLIMERGGKIIVADEALFAHRGAETRILKSRDIFKGCYVFSCKPDPYKFKSMDPKAIKVGDFNDKT